MSGPFNGRFISIVLASVLPASTAKIEGMGRWNIGITSAELDDSEFGTVWGGSVNGIQKWAGAFSGLFKFSTTAGSTGVYHALQVAFDQTKVQDIKFFLETTVAASAASSGPLFFMPNWSTTWTNYSTNAGCYLSNVQISADLNGLATLAFDVRGNGPIALASGTSVAAKVS